MKKGPLGVCLGGPLRGNIKVHHQICGQVIISFNLSYLFFLQPSGQILFIRAIFLWLTDLIEWLAFYFKTFSGFLYGVSISQPTDLIGWMELNLLLGVSHTIVYYMEASASVKCSEIEETTLQRAPGDESAGILRGSWSAPTYYLAVASHKQTVQVELFYIQESSLLSCMCFVKCCMIF